MAEADEVEEDMAVRCRGLFKLSGRGAICLNLVASEIASDSIFLEKKCGYSIRY